MEMLVSGSHLADISGILNGGMGAEPLLYDASPFTMRIAKKWQNMETTTERHGLEPQQPEAY